MPTKEQVKRKKKRDYYKALKEKGKATVCSNEQTEATTMVLSETGEIGTPSDAKPDLSIHHVKTEPPDQLEMDATSAGDSQSDTPGLVMTVDVKEDVDPATPSSSSQEDVSDLKPCPATLEIKEEPPDSHDLAALTVKQEPPDSPDMATLTVEEERTDPHLATLGVKEEPQDPTIDSSSVAGPTSTSFEIHHHSQCLKDDFGTGSIKVRHEVNGEHRESVSQHTDSTQFGRDDVITPGHRNTDEETLRGGVSEESVSSSSSPNLSRHKGLHTGKKRYECDDCGRTFARLGHLNQHRVTHTGEKPFKCNDCGTTFTRRGCLIRHKILHVGEKHHMCDVCGRAFAQRSNITQHRLTHTGEKHHKCGDCGKAFAQRRHLIQHQQLHTGEKNYKCEECGKAFAQQSGLSQHMLIHLAEKRYKCDECGRGFTLRSTLTTHKLLHTGVKPHRCDFCGKGFTQRWTLNKHKLIHTGEKRYKCDACGRRFTRRDTLNRHRSIHAPDIVDRAQLLEDEDVLWP